MDHTQVADQAEFEPFGIYKPETSLTDIVGGRK